MAKNRKHWSTSTDHELYEALRKLSEKTRIPVSKLLDEAIEDLLLKHGFISKKTKTP
jgi:predicted DNA-binding protein